MTFPPNLNAPANGAFAVTPSDSTEFSQPIRQLTVNVAGTVSFHSMDGVVQTTGTLPVGNYSFYARRIRATGTTATGLTGWF